MKHLSGKLAPGVDWNFLIHGDGTVSVGVAASGLSVKPKAGFTKFDILSVEQTLPFEVKVAGHRCRPRIVLKIYVRPNQKLVRKIREGSLAALSKKKSKCKTSN